MKKTIATLALLVSSTQAMALVGPGPTPKYVTICVKTMKAADNSKIAECDASYINEGSKAKVLKNGCLAGQISLTVVGTASPLDSCLPPGAMQL